MRPLTALNGCSVPVPQKPGQAQVLPEEARFLGRIGNRAAAAAV